MPLLHHTLLHAPAAQPSRWMLFLHGIFGSGSNWRSFARRMVEARPDWGAALVDLREHGDSRGLPPPHTLGAAAADLVALGAHLPGPVGGVLGHSFGGKVALRYVRDASGQLDEAWIIDAMPGARPGARSSEEVGRVLQVLRELPGPHPSRQAFVAAIVARGFDRPTAEWLAMNLRLSGGAFHLQLALDALGALLDSYFAEDLWDVLERPPGRARLHLVIGERSPVFGPEDRERALGCARRAPGRVAVHLLPAGHYVHVDDPEGLLRAVTAA